jgi:hypothetical protein
MKKILQVSVVICVAVLLGGPALAQTAVAPPPRPAGSGPSLAVTMQFIQAKLSEQGKVNFAVYSHNNANGTDWTNLMSEENTNVAADPSTCRISYHWKATRDGAVTFDQDYWFSLRDVQKLEVRTGEQNQKKVDTDAGNPSLDTRVDPPFFALVARRPGNIENHFLFTDEDTANRVAKAMVHAVELCGGGDKDPF